MRKGFTLVELLVVLAILGILLGLVTASMGGCRGATYYTQTNSGVYQCVKTYTVNAGENATSKRVDLRPKDGGTVQTFTVDDNFYVGVRNSATLYAQFEPGRWYTVDTVGSRQEGYYSFFPAVKSVMEVPDPNQ